MAQRVNTVSYAFPARTTVVADAVATALADLVVDVPTAGRVFRSVTITVSADDVITATGGTIGEWRVGCQIDAVAYNTATEGNDIVNTGENLSVLLGPVDFTSYFQTNFTGGSHTVRCQVYFDQTTGTTLGMINVCATLEITYEYDDTANTRLKTVYIPLESPVGAVGVTLAEIGTNQIPALDTFLPEAGKVYKDIYFELLFNESTTTTNDATLQLALDAEAAFSSGVYERGLQSARFCRFIWKRTDMATNVTHQFRAASVGAAGRNHMTITLVVTYEYDEALTTSCMVSMLLPFEMPSPLSLSSALFTSKFTRSLTIAQSNPVLRQSGARLCFNTNANVAGINVSLGTQAFRVYTHNAGTVTCGGFILQQRLDSGSAQGAGMTLQQGANTLDFRSFTTDTTNRATNLSGLFLLNYTCDKPVGGSHLLPVTTKWAMERIRASANRHPIADFRPRLPETDYRLVGLGFEMILMQGATVNSIILSARIAAGEGFRDLYADTLIGDGEIGVSLTYCRARDDFQRYPDDPDANRMVLVLDRTYLLYFPATAFYGMSMLVTHQPQTFAINGTVSGFSGDGSGIEVDLYSANTGELLKTFVTGIGGVYSGTWYNPTELLYTVARQDGTRVGRSDNFTAG